MYMHLYSDSLSICAVFQSSVVVVVCLGYVLISNSLVTHNHYRVVQLYIQLYYPVVFCLGPLVWLRPLVLVYVLTQCIICKQGSQQAFTTWMCLFFLSADV